MAVSNNNHAYMYICTSVLKRVVFILTNMYSILRHFVSQNCCSVFSEKCMVRSRFPQLHVCAFPVYLQTVNFQFVIYFYITITCITVLHWIIVFINKWRQVLELLQFLFKEGYFSCWRMSQKVILISWCWQGLSGN